MSRQKELAAGNTRPTSESDFAVTGSYLSRNPARKRRSVGLAEGAVSSPPVVSYKRVPQFSPRHAWLRIGSAFGRIEGTETGVSHLKTSVSEFTGWLDLVPEGLKPHLVATRKKGKAPLVPKNRSWKDDEFRLQTGEAKQWLAEGGNIAFVARRDLAVIDVDDEGVARGVLDDGLFHTLTVSTRSGGVHLYFVNGGVENADYEEAFEIRAEWRYVLVPGSYVDPGDTGGNGKYEISSDRSPELLVPDDLPEEVRRKRIGKRDFTPRIRKPGEAFENEHGWTLKECRSEDEKLDALLTHLRFKDMPERARSLFDPSKDISRSGLDMATAYKLAYWEFDYQSCIDILREYRSYWKTVRDDYVDMTVGKALELVEETVSDHHNPETWSPGVDDIFDRLSAGGGKSG